MSLRPPIDVAAHVSAELSAIIEALVDDPNREQPSTLALEDRIMFNSPLEYCTVCQMYVALDQSQRECAAEHGCTLQQPCPLAYLFAAYDSGAVPEHAGDAPAAKTQTGTPAPQR